MWASSQIPSQTFIDFRVCIIWEVCSYLCLFLGGERTLVTFVSLLNGENIARSHNPNVEFSHRVQGSKPKL